MGGMGNGRVVDDTTGLGVGLEGIIGVGIGIGIATGLGFENGMRMKVGRCGGGHERNRVRGIESDQGGGVETEGKG